MNEGALFISVVGLMVVPLIAYLLLRGTLFDITHLRPNPWPLLWYYELATILIPLVIVSAVGIDHVPVFFMAEPGTEGEIAVLVIVTLIMYITTLAFSLRLFGLYREKVVATTELPIGRLVFALCVIGILLVGSFYILGYKHAFLTSILEGRRLLEVRLANRYTSRVPSQIQSMLWLIGYLLAALAGYLGRTSPKKSLFYLMVALFILSTPGDKAPPLWGFFVWMLAQGKLMPKRLFSLKALVYFLVIVCLALGGVYFVLSFQIPELTLEKYSAYLVNRLGIGQMAGVYETFGLEKSGSLPKGDFYWHMFPGARLFVDYVEYQKVLMMVTEGYGYSEMGVKNSYFIAEAYAMGGFPLMFLSPIIVAFSTALGLIILIDLLKRIVGKELCRPIATLLYLKTQSITGGFSHFPLIKGVILVVGQLFIIWILCIIVMHFTNFSLKGRLYVKRHSKVPTLGQENSLPPFVSS